MRGLYDDAAAGAGAPAFRGQPARPDGAAESTPAGSSPLARFDCREVQGCAVVGAAGEIDVATAPAFCAALLDGVEHSERLVVDMSGVTFLDCCGLSALVTAVRRVRPTGGALHLVGVAGLVARLITLTRLEEVVTVDASLEDALASLAATG